MTVASKLSQTAQNGSFLAISGPQMYPHFGANLLVSAIQNPCKYSITLLQFLWEVAKYARICPVSHPPCRPECARILANTGLESEKRSGMSQNMHQIVIIHAPF